MGRLERQITVRVSDELDEAIERDARGNGRTKGQTVRFVLERHYRLRDGD